MRASGRLADEWSYQSSTTGSRAIARVRPKDLRTPQQQSCRDAMRAAATVFRLLTDPDLAAWRASLSECPQTWSEWNQFLSSALLEQSYSPLSPLAASQVTIIPSADSAELSCIALDYQTATPSPTGTIEVRVRSQDFRHLGPFPAAYLPADQRWHATLTKLTPLQTYQIRLWDPTANQPISGLYITTLIPVTAQYMLLVSGGHLLLADSAKLELEEL